jgi:hypothetical protein
VNVIFLNQFADFEKGFAHFDAELFGFFAASDGASVVVG